VTSVIGLQYTRTHVHTAAAHSNAGVSDCSISRVLCFYSTRMHTLQQFVSAAVSGGEVKGWLQVIV
jgi:hypothetical protein